MKKSVKGALIAGFILLQTAIVVLLILLISGVFGTGPQGERGDQGEQGVPGVSGETPFIGENGNWWIGDTDTGVPAQGEKGDKGDKGEKGDSYTGEHRWQSAFTVEARCEEPGVIFYTCLDCKETKIEPLQPLGHDYEDGVCSRCFKLQPDEGLRFRKTEDKTGYRVSGIGSCEETEIVVPEMHEGMPVVGVIDGAFHNNTSITEVHLPESVLSIGLNAFAGCSSLTRIELPAGVTVIEDDTFLGCSSLSEVILPEGLHSIGESAFSGCRSLKSIVLPARLSSLGERAFKESGLISPELPSAFTVVPLGLFENCLSLERVSLPENVERVESFAFYGCEKLQEISLPKARELGDSVFYGCTSLKEVEFGETLSALGDTVFVNCSLLTEISVPQGIKTLGRELFFGCTSLASVTLPEGLEEIGISAFQNCSSLVEITIPASVTCIWNSAFLNCSRLERALLKNTENWTAEHGELRIYISSQLTDPAAVAKLLVKNYWNYIWRRT